MISSFHFERLAPFIPSFSPSFISYTNLPSLFSLSLFLLPLSLLSLLFLFSCCLLLSLLFFFLFLSFFLSSLFFLSLLFFLLLQIWRHIHLLFKQFNQSKVLRQFFCALDLWVHNHLIICYRSLFNKNIVKILYSGVKYGFKKEYSIPIAKK